MVPGPADPGGRPLAVTHEKEPGLLSALWAERPAPDKSTFPVVWGQREVSRKEIKKKKSGGENQKLAFFIPQMPWWEEAFLSKLPRLDNSRFQLVLCPLSWLFLSPPSLLDLPQLLDLLKALPSSSPPPPPPGKLGSMYSP